MKNSIYYVSTLFLSLFITSCNWGNSCGKNEKFDTKYNATRLNTKINAYYYNEIDTSKNYFNQVNIYLKFYGRSYSVNQSPTFSWIQSVYACSPPDLISYEKITNIEITCLQDYNNTYPKGKIINDMLEISHRQLGKSTIDEYLKKSPTIDDVTLTLTEAPDHSQKYSFIIKYEFEGKLTKTLIDTTEHVFILK